MSPTAEPLEAESTAGESPDVNSREDGPGAATPSWLSPGAGRTGRSRVTWRERDAALYALGVGAAVANPSGDDLRFVTDGGPDRPQLVLPTFATVVGSTHRIEALETLDRSRVVHGEQAVRLFVDLPPSGSLDAESTLSAVYDKGTGALVVIETRGIDVATRQCLFQTTTSLFVRGAGGFGGARGPRDGRVAPDRSPDEVVIHATRPDQALVYQLSGDHNPLHWDPAFARQAGFDRPPLHGLCTFGFAGRALLERACGGQPARFGSITGRFSKPAFPGDILRTSLWFHDEATLFTVSDQHGATLIDRGHFTERPQG